MKIDLLSLTAVIICIATVHSSPFPNWMDETQDLNMKRLLELQEEGSDPTTPPPRLRCFICEKDCANEEELETCESGFSCSTVTAHKTEIEIITEMKIKVCLPPVFCSSDLVCSNLNKTGELESCNVECCNIDECNAEPTSPTSEPLTAPPTTQPPTTPAPQIIPLRGNSGRFRSPGFSSGSYPPNLDITWTVSRRTMRGLLLEFLTIDTERGKDIITIRRGNSVVRTFSGAYRSRGKRSLSIPLYPEDGPCGEDDDEVDDHDDYFGYDTLYDRLADAYGRYRRRRRRPRAPCVSVRGNQISINFSSDGNDTGQRGFEARFRVFRGGDDK